MLFSHQRRTLPSLICYTFILFACAFAAGCHRVSGGTGLTKVTLQADWYPQPEHGGFYTALAKGYYNDKCLDVSIQPPACASVDDPSGGELGKTDSARWNTMYRQLFDLKVITKQFDPATAYTLQFVGSN
jgi:hypothetical protein